jgi:RluA family pseudouridine synthase
MSDGGSQATPGPDPAQLDLASRVPDAAHGTPLIDYLVARFRYHDRGEWLSAVHAGRITVDGRRVPADHLLKARSSLVYHKVHHEPAVPRELRVLYDDDALLVVDKPALLPMHADGPFVRNTLVWLARALPGNAQVQLVHRLDRETSGVVVLARNGAARAALERQFAGGQIEKVYLALVAGVVAADFRSDAPIGHAAGSTIALRRSAAPDARGARPAATDFAVVARGADSTLLRCTPHTGRTHQIRVHLEHAGHPVLGDKLYGRPDADYLAFVARVKAGGDARDTTSGRPSRQLLHAAELALTHPLDGSRRRFSAPLPADFDEWLPPPGNAP